MRGHSKEIPVEEPPVKLAAVAAALSVIAIPLAVQGAQAPSSSSSIEKRTCDVNVPTGSRLGGVRRCRTASEREAAKQEARTVVDRIQAMKPTLCQPNQPC
jgi:hypothetical protein